MNSEDDRTPEITERDISEDEKQTFEDLPNKEKINRLNNLIQQAQVYSQIILDNMLEKSLEKKKEQQKAKKRLRRAKRRERAEKKKKIESGELSPLALSESEPDEDDDDDEEEEEEEPKEEEQKDDEKEDDKEESDVEITEVRATRTTRSGRELPSRKRRKLKKESKKKRKTELPTQEASEKTKETRKALEQAQTAHNQSQPALVSGCTMKDYQLDGLEWLVSLYENGLNGILADEMGLGKTLQTISLIAYLFEHKVREPVLIVAPLSTVDNWCREFERFAPRISIINYTGTKPSRAKIGFGKRLNRKVVITSYEVALKDYAKLRRQSWSYMTVDEGHRLKNFECKLIQALRKLNTANRLLLTGTPLQNNLNELWSLLNFILPDIFHDLELFQSWFDFDDILGQGSHADKVLQKEMQEKLVTSLHSILKPFLLRRLKKDVVKNLPPKREYIVYAELTPFQRTMYSAALKRDLVGSVIEAYAKEYFFYNFPESFGSKEALQKLHHWLRFQPIDDDEDPKASRRRKNQKYTPEMMGFIQSSGFENLEDQDYSLPAESSESEHALKEDIQLEIEKRTQELERHLMAELANYPQVKTEEDGVKEPNGVKQESTGIKQELNGGKEPNGVKEEPNLQNGQTDPEAELPDVIEILDDTDLTPDERQRTIYEREIETIKQYVMNSALQNIVMQLRKICGSHYSYYLPLDEESGKLDLMAQLITVHSGKMQVLKQLLEPLLKENHKVLIFSQFSMMLDLIALVLENEGIALSRLDGRYSQEERAEELKSFRKNESNQVFLLSTRAGGLGINLADADTVILFDSDWNPQMDLQAIDRAHRIGQEKPVKVFRLVVRKTVEELLIVKSFNKRLLERMVIELGEFQIGRVAKKLADEKIDLEKINSIVSILDIGKKLDLYGTDEKEFTMETVDNLLVEEKKPKSYLTSEEMAELMDRSEDCYKRKAIDIKLPNVVAFESSNLEGEL